MLLTFAVLIAACSVSPSQNSEPALTAVNPKVRPPTIPQAAIDEYQTVLALIDAKEWQNAQTMLQQMQAAYPRLHSLKASLGWIYWQSGETEKAIQELQAAIDTEYLYKSDAYNYLAIIYREQGQFLRSEALYKEALGIWTGDKKLYQNLGILYELYMNRLADALAQYQQAQAIDSKDKQLNGWIKSLNRRVNK
ncbi:MAG: tetratricopeptide repeat protein [Pseudomonadota bacterium]